MERGKKTETFKEKMRASEWAFDRMKEAFDLVAQDEARKVSVVQEIMFKSTDTCAVSSHQSEDKEVSQCRTCARTATVSLWKITSGGSQGEIPQSGGV